MTLSTDNATVNWIKRPEVAKILETSVGSVRRREGADLSPKKDERGVWWFLESEVRELARRLKEAKTKVEETCDGETAAQAFELFDAGGRYERDAVDRRRDREELARLQREAADAERRARERDRELWLELGGTLD